VKPRDKTVVDRRSGWCPWRLLNCCWHCLNFPQPTSNLVAWDWWSLPHGI